MAQTVQEPELIAARHERRRPVDRSSDLGAAAEGARGGNDIRRWVQGMNYPNRST